MLEHVLILGGGISGLSMAWRLSERGIAVSLLEQNRIVGGLAATLRESGYCMDVGPHSFFSEDREIVRTVLDLFEGTLKPLQRKVKFYYQGKYLDYPLTASSVLFQMGLGSGIHAAMSFLKGKLTPRRRKRSEADEETVEEWARGSFGEHLYRTFFKPYTEQFWKVSCSELSSRSIPYHTRTSFANTCRLLLHKKVAKDGTSLVEREMLPTYYPDSGFGEIAERIAGASRKNGARILLRCRVVGVETGGGDNVRVEYECDGETKEVVGSHVISTIPLNDLIGMMRPGPPRDVLASAEALDYRSLIVLGMVTAKQDILECGYVYVLNRPYNRITEMNEFSPRTSPPAENILVVEIPCLFGSAAWKASKEELFDMCIGSLAEDGFLLPGDVKDLLIVKASHTYPIYRKNYAPNLSKVKSYIDDCERIESLGRAGEFRYMDIDRCMRGAFELADRLVEGPVRFPEEGRIGGSADE